MHYSLLTALCWSLTGIFIVFLADIPPLNIVWSPRGSRGIRSFCDYATFTEKAPTIP